MDSANVTATEQVADDFLYHRQHSEPSSRVTASTPLLVPLVRPATPFHSCPSESAAVSPLRIAILLADVGAVGNVALRSPIINS
jgi:hypothetical protein